MNIIGVIPARMDSSRFPGKPMKKILDMPMVEHCYWRTSLAVGRDNTYVATCDSEIFDHISCIGGNAVMTAKSHTRATTRTSEALEKIEQEIGRKCDLVLMIQGDEPLIHPNAIKGMVEIMRDPSVDIVNIMSRFQTINEFQDENNVKVVVDNASNALYFSRQPIPSPWKGFCKDTSFMQTGIIGFRRQCLLDFNMSEETRLEQIESVDMNRVLELGGTVRMSLMQGKTIGVDVPGDLEIAATHMHGDDAYKLYSSNDSKGTV